ncbi:MAG: anti-sigma factor antagonist [Lachnospiraceae bacterium]|nr:anti-sigma factor antagonist [Lachnospiraceae bacterium]
MITIKLKGRIDSNNAGAFEEEVLKNLAKGASDGVVFDASDLEYISSAGLRVLMKVLKAQGAENVSVIEVSSEIYDIFEITGFTELLKIKKKMRRISVDGCEVIGKGFYGTVYRIDADTIIKVYDSPDCLPMIENEKKMARLAFLKGIPTAISYDIVRVGDSYGSVFELLKAKSFNDLIIEKPESIDETIRTYVDFIKLVHGTSAGEGELPSARARYLDHLECIKGYLDDDMYKGLKDLLESVAKENGIVHGDIQMKNVMMVDNEPMLIDMDTLSMGSPIFDFAGLYVTYREFAEDEPDNTMNFLGIDNATAGKIWEGILRDYFGTDDPDTLKDLSDKIRLVAAVRFMYIVTASDLKDGDLGQKRIANTKEHISKLLGLVRDLVFIDKNTDC